MELLYTLWSNGKRDAASVAPGIPGPGDPALGFEAAQSLAQVGFGDIECFEYIAWSHTLGVAQYGEDLETRRANTDAVKDAAVGQSLEP